MSDRDALRVAVWGIGSHVRRNLIPAFENSIATRLVALHTRDDVVLAEVAGLTGARPYRDVADLLAASGVDVIFVATPTGLHGDMALAAIEAGKHLWCEKPMTMGYEQTKVVIDAAAEAGLVALESDMFLHHPQFLGLKNLVDSQAIGRLASMTARFGFPHRPRTDFRYSTELGGGATLDAGFYPVAAAVALLGTSLRLAGASVTREPETGLDTGGTAFATSTHGAAILDWGFGRSYRNEIEVWGEDGVIEVTRVFSKPSTLESEIVVRHQSGEVRRVSLAPADQFALMIDDFADITMGFAPYDPTPTLERARLLTAISESEAAL